MQLQAALSGITLIELKDKVTHKRTFKDNFTALLKTDDVQVSF